MTPNKRPVSENGHHLLPVELRATCVQNPEPGVEKETIGRCNARATLGA